jgi:hypothetical protein
MAEYTGPMVDAPVNAIPAAKQTINPALVKALVPPARSTPLLSSQDQRAFDLAEAKRKADVQTKIAEENRAAARKLEEEQRKETAKRSEEERQLTNPTGAPTEGERTAATLLQRLQFSQQQLKDALAEDQTAAKPQLLPSLIGVISETAANSMRSPVRQRIEGAQLDLLDAALTLGTGASYTKEQLKGYRESYFPQIGDSPAAIKDKQARLSNVIEAAKIKSGRSARLVPEVKSSVSVDAPPVTALKEGHTTTFANGQQWTLQQGKQVRVK